MSQVNYLSSVHLLTYLKQDLPFYIKRCYRIALLLVLCMLCGSWTSAIYGQVIELDMPERPEEGKTTAVLVLRLTNNAVAPSDISITYDVNPTASNPAVNGTDYTFLTGTATILAGQNQVQIPIVVTDDLDIEGEENLEFELTAATDQGGVSYMPSIFKLTTTVLDNDNRLSITKVADGAELGGGAASNGSFQIKLPGTLIFNEGILVKYVIDGGSTATGGAGTTNDYNNTPLSTGEILLPANTNSIPLPIIVNDDQIIEGDETVFVTIQDNSLSDVTSMRFTFDPAQATAVVIIEDDDDVIPVNILATVDGQEPGGAGNDGSFKIGFPDGFYTTNSVVVRYTIGGTATGAGNIDYNAITLTRLIPAGTSNVTIPVTVKDDYLVEGPETVILTITGFTLGTGVPPLTIGTTSPATVTIADNDVMSSLQWKSAAYTGTGAAGAATAGDLITYTVHVRNTGNVNLTNVIISDNIPANTEFVSADGGITPDGTGKLTWTIPTIAAGPPDVTRSFIVRVANDLTGVTNITNTALVDNGDGTGNHPTTPSDPGNPNNPHPGPVNPGDPSTNVPVDDGGKQSANWKSAAYTGTGAGGRVKPADLITYTVHVRNTGHVRLTNVNITDNIPAYTEFVSADDGITPDGAGRLTWTIPEIAVGATNVTRSFVVRVVNDLTGATSIPNTAGVDNGNGTGEQPTTPPDPGNANNPHPSPTPGDPSTNIPVDNTKRSANWKSAAYTGTGAGGAVKAGDLITYTVHVRNTGYVKLENVTISDDLPAYTEFVSADGGITPDGTGKLTWTITEIAVGAADVTRSFVVRVISDLIGATYITNTALVDNGDGTGDHPTTPPDPGNPNNPHTNPNPGDPSTNIPVYNKKSANWKSAAYTGTGAAGAVRTGDQITYTVHVRNTGNVSLTNVIISDNIPAYTEFVSADGGITPDGTGKLSWTVPAIAVGAADVTRSFIVRVVNDLTGATNITNTAMVDNGDGTGENPTTPSDPGNPNNPHPGPVNPGDPSTNVPVDDGGKLSANWKSAAYTGTGANGTVKPGDQITYTVHIRNTGHVRLTNVLITDNLPAYTEFVSAEGGITPDGTGKLTWTITDIAVGAADVTRSFVVRVANDLTGATGIINTAGVDNGTGENPTTPPDPANPNNPHTNPNPGDPSTNVPVDNIKRSVNWKSASYTGTGLNGAVKSGDEIIYTLHIRNTGYVNLTNVVITDNLPAYTEFISAEGGITPDGTGKLTWTIANIAVGAADVTRSFTVRVVNDLTNAGFIINTAWVDNGDGQGNHPTGPQDPGNPNEPLPNPNPNDPATEIPVDNGKNSANWKSATYTGTGEGGSVTTGDLITYTLHVRNTGNATLWNVLLKDNVPAYTEFVSAEGGIVPNGTGTLTWTITGIAVGAPDITRSFTVRVVRDLTGATSIINTAAVDNGNGQGEQPTTPPAPGNPNDPHPSPDPGDPATEIPVDTVMGFDTWKTVTTESGGVKAKPGEVLTYMLYLRNTGNVIIPVMNVADPVPAHTTFISAADGGTHDIATNTVNWVVNNLAVGATSRVTFRVRVDADLDSAITIVNNATASDGNVTKPTAGCDPALPGCTGHPGTSIETEEPVGELFFVNAMSPNGDGKNEYFTIRGLEKYPGASLFVFNRWGNMVYQAKDYRNDWNGAGLSEGTYYYKLELKQPQGTKLYKGWVVIKRN